MDGGHEALLDPELFVNDFDKRRKAVGCTGGTRNHLHFGLVVIRVDANDDRWCLSVFGWCRDNHFLCTALDVFQAALSSCEGASRLADVVNTRFGPRNLSGVTRRREGDRKPIDLETTLGKLDGTIEAA